MKLKYNFVLNTVADNIVAVAVGDDLENFNGFVKMNDIGAEIFEILKNDVTIDDIVKAMCEKHPDEPQQEVADTVNEFVGKLKEEGILA